MEQSELLDIIKEVDAKGRVRRILQDATVKKYLRRNNSSFLIPQYDSEFYVYRSLSNEIILILDMDIFDFYSLDDITTINLHISNKYIHQIYGADKPLTLNEIGLIYKGFRDIIGTWFHWNPDDIRAKVLVDAYLSGFYNHMTPANELPYDTR